MRSMRGQSVTALAGLLLAVGVVAGCKKEAAPVVEVTVQAEKPELGAISEHIVADAVLEPVAQAAIVPKISSPVKKFYVQRGAHVREGELLATLENGDLTAAAMDSKGSYMAAAAAYATETKAQVPEDTLKAEADVAEGKANLDLNASIVKSRKQLFAEGAIPGRDLDTAQAALVEAQAAYDAAAKHLENVKAVSRAAALKGAEGQLTSVEGKLKGAEAQVGYSEIRSPIDGVVTDRPLFAGETAAAGAMLLTVMDTRVLLAKTHVAQNVAQRLKVDDEAAVTVPGVADAVAGKVQLISPALDAGSTTVEVWVRLENKAGALKVGTPVKVSITGRTEAKALKIPLKAVQTGQDGAKSVMVVGSDGLAHKKAVTLGIADGDDVQVLTGVDEADQVITGGAYGMDDGTKVKVGAADDAKPDAGGGE